MKNFIVGYDKFYGALTAPFATLFSRNNLPQTVFAFCLLFMSVSCHNSTPYSAPYEKEQNAQFPNSNGYKIGLPTSSHSERDTLAESPQQYGKRAIDSAKAAIVEKSTELAIPDPIVSSPVIYDTLQVVSPAALPAKKIKSPAEKAAIAAKNAKGLPAESIAKTQKIDNSNKELKLRKPYDCKCLDKIQITKGSTAFSMIRRNQKKYPNLTLTTLAEINKPKVVTQWQLGTFVCLKRDKK